MCRNFEYRKLVFHVQFKVLVLELVVAGVLAVVEIAFAATSVVTYLSVAYWANVRIELRRYFIAMPWIPFTFSQDIDGRKS